MPRITKNDKPTKKIDKEKTTSEVAETVASKAVKEAKKKIESRAEKEARKKVASEKKEALVKELDIEKSKDTIKAEETEKEKEKKNDKEESVIQKIKNFIAKIVAMQEEARLEAENKKALKESIEVDKEKAKKEDKQKPQYMLEYYDLPYRYNETVVKILAQTPKRLFVYWDISDSDRKKYETAFGESFFEDTYPILLVHNEEKGYTFEVPINDFANSWYLDINDPKSKYVIQLGRKFKFKPEYINIVSSEDTKNIEIYDDYVPIITSNVLEVPNDHILFENIEEKALYRNVKTNEETYVEIANSEFLNKMGNIYDVYDLYKEIYKNEIGDGSLMDLLNPSSMSSSGTNSSVFR